MDYTTVGGQEPVPHYLESSHLQTNDDSEIFFTGSEDVDSGTVPTYFSRLSEPYRHSPGMYAMMAREFDHIDATEAVLLVYLACWMSRKVHLFWYPAIHSSQSDAS